MIKVGVLGAKGRMGSLVAETVRSAEDLELVAEVDVEDPPDALKGCDVVVDFTSPVGVLDNMAWCVQAGLSMVVGTSGFDGPRLTEAGRIVDAAGAVEASKPRVLVVPNFSVGAVLMMKFAEQAARFFESAEIIELHHPDKADAPSGTARRTAEIVAAARADAGQPAMPDATTSESPGSRGARIDGVRVHSVRLRGLLAHQEVLLGGRGETLTIRHDSTDRESFMPGVVAAIRAVGDRPGLTVGLDRVLGLV